MTAPTQVQNTELFSLRFVTPLLMASTLNPINTSLIATALVPIAGAVHVSVGQTAVLVSALYLASALAQPTAGKLAEEFGPRRVFLVGLVIVLTGGLVGGFGQDLTTLIVARVLIGLGSSAVYPSAMPLIRRRAHAAGLAAPPGRVLGGLVVAGSATAALGLPIGGILVNAWGWRTAFFVNLPFAGLALVMTLRWIPPDGRVEGSRSFREIATRIDLAGIVGFGATVAALLVVLLGLPHTDWIALGLAVVLGAGLVSWELRANRPFFDVRLLATHIALTRTYLRYALGALCVYTVLYGLTQWLEAGRGMSPQEAGLLLLPMAGLSALIAQPISQRNLVRLPLIAAAVACLAASAGVLVLTASTPIIWIVVITLGFGVTLGAMVSANQTTLYHQVAPDQIGTASGLFKTFGSIGSIASSALIAIAFHTNVSDTHLHAIALIMVVVSVLGLVIVIADRKIMSQAHVREAGAPTAPQLRLERDSEPARRSPTARRHTAPRAGRGGRMTPHTATSTSRATAARHMPGDARRRGSTLEDALLDATWSELRVVGYAKLTMEGVAQRAGISRPVLARRWPTRPELVIAALRRHRPMLSGEVPDTGNFREDVFAVLRRTSAGLTEIGPETIYGLLGDYFADPALVPELQAQVGSIGAEVMATILQRAAQRGEARDDIPLRVATLPIDLLRHELFRSLSPADEHAMTEIVDQVFLPLVRR